MSVLFNLSSEQWESCKAAVPVIDAEKFTFMDECVERTVTAPSWPLVVTGKESNSLSRKTPLWLNQFISDYGDRITIDKVALPVPVVTSSKSVKLAFAKTILRALKLHSISYQVT